MDELYATAAAIIERRRDELKINAGWVANETLRAIDPDRISVPSVYLAAGEHIKQYARSLFGKTFDATQEDKPQPWLSMSKKWHWEPQGNRPWCGWWDGPPYIPITDALPTDHIPYSMLTFFIDGT